MTTSNIKTTLSCDIYKVWKTVLDVAEYGAWRSDLSRTEIVSGQQFIEYTRDGYPTTFTVTLTEPYRRWEFDMENSNMKGHWVGVFTDRGSSTEIDFTEYVTAKKLIMKPFVNGCLKRQQKLFVWDLKKKLHIK